MTYFQRGGLKANVMHVFGYTSVDGSSSRPSQVQHTTHLQADLTVLSNVPFHQRVFHRDLNVQDEDHNHQKDFVYGRPVPGMHSQPLPARETINGVEVLWQIPPPPLRIKYIMLLFHGCGRRAMSFYSSPEGVAVVQQLLNSNYAVAAFSKQNDLHGCWEMSTGKETKGGEEEGRKGTTKGENGENGENGEKEEKEEGDRGAKNNPPPKNEVLQVADAVRQWIQRLKQIPHWESRTSYVAPIVHGFGVSSGGHFLVELATNPTYQDLHIHAIHVQVAAPVVHPLERWQRVPIYFTMMSRDWNIKSEIKRLTTQLTDLNVPHAVHEYKALQITRDYFRQRVKGVSKSLSGAMYRMLHDDDIINADGELLMDPRRLQHGIGPLVSFVHGGKRAPPGVSDDLLRILSNDELARSQVVWIAEELNVAWDAHEINGDHFPQVLQWLQGKDNLGGCCWLLGGAVWGVEGECGKVVVVDVFALNFLFLISFFC